MYNIDEIKNKIICGDAFTELSKIPSESIDLIVTDPPYGVNYKGGTQNRDEENIIRGDDFVLDYRVLLDEFHRLLKPEGSAYMFYANGQENNIFPISKFCKHQILIWYKIKGGHPDFLARYKHLYEPILYLSKSSPTKWNGNTVQVDVFADLKFKNILHPTQKPLKVISKMVENSSYENDIVLDPFVGSGTTCVAAKILKRSYIGIEIDARYVNMTEERLKDY